MLPCCLSHSKAKLSNSCKQGHPSAGESALVHFTMPVTKIAEVRLKETFQQALRHTYCDLKRPQPPRLLTASLSRAQTTHPLHLHYPLLWPPQRLRPPCAACLLQGPLFVMARMELCPPPTPPVSTSAPVIHWAPTGETAGGWHPKGAVVGQGRGRCDEEDHGKAVLTSARHGVPIQSCLVPALKQSPGSGPCTLGQAEAC